MLRYRTNQADGRRVENTLPVGLVADYPKEKDAWREVDRLGLRVRINDESSDVRIRFDALAEFYLKADFGPDAVRPKSVNTIPITRHIVRDYLIKRWGEAIAQDIRPLDLQCWLKSLHEDKKLAWTTISKMRGVMSRIYKVGMLHEKVSKNPLQYVQTRCKTNYRAIVLSPAQTFGILKALKSLQHHALVLTCAATALRASEILALRWHDILWSEARIRVSKRWAGSDGAPKTDASDGYVPLHPLLAEHLHEWRQHTPYPAGYGLRLSVTEDERAHSHVRVHLRAGPSAPRRESCGCFNSGRPTLRTAQPAAFLKQLAGEQGEGRTQDRAGHPASRENSDDAGSLHPGRLGRSTGRAGAIPSGGHGFRSAAMTLWAGLWIGAGKGFPAKPLKKW